MFSVHQDTSFELSKSTFWQYSLFFFIAKGDPFDLGGIHFNAYHKNGSTLEKKLFGNPRDETNSKTGGYGKNYVFKNKTLPTLLMP